MFSYLIDQIYSVLQDFYRTFFLIIGVRVFHQLQNLFLCCFAEQNLKHISKKKKKNTSKIQQNTYTQ